MGKVYVIGVGADGPAGLSGPTLDIIRHADIILGGQRLLNFFAKGPGLRLPITADLEAAASLIAGRMKSEQIVVLASGDPNFYGIARYLAGILGKDGMEIIPSVSSMQLAFARIKESWDDAVLTSVHGRSMDDIIGLVRSGRKIGIFTDGQNSPGAIGRQLLAAGVGGYRAFVCQDLGSADEKVTETDLAGLEALEVSPLNVLVLIKDEAGATEDQRPRQWTLGVPDDEFFQRKPLRGLITKSEVRVVSLSRLNLRKDGVLWDIGAGSGSVSVEAALIGRCGQVYAVERNAADASIVRQNLDKFGVRNVTVVEGLAPGVLGLLPDPDAVFIGGSGGRMAAILDVIQRRLKAGGAVVANIATVSNLDAAARGLSDRGFEVDITMVNVARTKAVAGLLRFQSLDPVFIVSAVRPGVRECPPKSPVAWPRPGQGGVVGRQGL